MGDAYDLTPHPLLAPATHSRTSCSLMSGLLQNSSGDLRASRGRCEFVCGRNADGIRCVGRRGVCSVADRPLSLKAKRGYSPFG